MPEAPLEDVGAGLAPVDDGWFVVNVRDAAWQTAENSGRKPPGRTAASRAGSSRFHRSASRSACSSRVSRTASDHAENQQEAFLVLAGECRLLVEGEERLLRAWDFFHSPPGTEHIFVGAGDGPCTILMAGARLAEEELHYPVSELAARYGASVEEETTDFAQVYPGSSLRAESGPATGTASPGLADAGPFSTAIGEYARPAMARALIFDLDGTLVDTVYAHVFAWQRALAEEGMPIDAWRIHRRIGMSGGLFARAVAREVGRELSPTRSKPSRRAMGRSSASSCPSGIRCPGLGSCSRRSVSGASCTGSRRPVAVRRSTRRSTRWEWGTRRS